MEEKKIGKEVKPEEKKEMEKEIREIKEDRMDSIVKGAWIGKPREGKSTTEEIVKKVEKPKPKPKPSPPPVKKVENRNIPCILRFKKVTAKQAANVAKLFRKLKYTNYTSVHSKGHNEWDILVRFDNLDERDKFEKIINKLL